MHLKDFSFHLPKELIAQSPAIPRDSARLFVYTRATDTIQHMQVCDLPKLLPANTILVANNTRVRRARLRAVTGQQREVQILALEALNEDTYQCMIGGKGVVPGTFLTIVDEKGGYTPFIARILAREENPSMNTYRVRFNFNSKNPAKTTVEEFIEHYGTLPLPPYIEHPESTDDQYQTTFAKKTGSAAAPTAGLHFTPELIETLKKAGHSWEEITLEVGMGTFLPLRHDVITDNSLHSEKTAITEEVAEHLTRAVAQSTPILTVGTTATRTLESHTEHGLVAAGEQATNMFIYPGYQFKAVNHLLTNFHLPQSSLLLLVAAFLGNNQSHNAITKSEAQMIALLQRLYAEAIKKEYRFFSFGDAMLIL
jgi:S-adenosylmethionine:tRNA ribosyltransferase-isomerase